MAAASDVTSPLSRARFSVMVWIDSLPDEAKSEAAMAMDTLMQVAEREIENAYRDGMNHRSAAVRAQKLRQEALPVTNGVRNPGES